MIYNKIKSNQRQGYSHPLCLSYSMALCEPDQTTKSGKMHITWYYIQTSQSFFYCFGWINPLKRKILIRIQNLTSINRQEKNLSSCQEIFLTWLILSWMPAPTSRRAVLAEALSLHGSIELRVLFLGSCRYSLRAAHVSPANLEGKYISILVI